MLRGVRSCGASGQHAHGMNGVAVPAHRQLASVAHGRVVLGAWNRRVLHPHTTRVMRARTRMSAHARAPAAGRSGRAPQGTSRAPSSSPARGRRSPRSTLAATAARRFSPAALPCWCRTGRPAAGTAAASRGSPLHARTSCHPHVVSSSAHPPAHASTLTRVGEQKGQRCQHRRPGNGRHLAHCVPGRSLDNLPHATRGDAETSRALVGTAHLLGAVIRGGDLRLCLRLEGAKVVHDVHQRLRRAAQH
jgi:hypothetical protein